jgi:DNA-binding helix-hairpin-helix protein with protein kinase domain
MPTSPPIKPTVSAADIHRMTVTETDLSMARLAAVLSVEGMEPHSGRANGIPLRPRNDNTARLSFVMPDQTSAPLRRREIEAAVARLAPAVEPFFEQAYRLTQARLDEPAATASEQESQSLVRNTFNVTVALGGNGVSESPDRTALEEALTDILCTAARRHGLEI